MSINVFEGARRIAKLVALIWVVGCVIFFTIDISEMKPPINEANITWDDSGDWVDVVPGAMSAQQADDGDWVDEPKTQEQTQKFDVDPQEWLKQHRALKLKPGAPNPQEWVKEYRKQKEALQAQQATKPVMTPEEEWLAKRRFERVGIGALTLFGGVAFIWSLTWAIGWIVRGFLGIPSGQDFKP